MARYGRLDYPLLTKAGFLLGVALLALGGGGGILAHSIYGSLPGWTDTLFVDLEALGILLGLLSPFVFGLLLPLTE